MHKIRYEGRSHETWGELPDVGSRAPDVSLVNTRLQDVSLASWHGLRKVIFSFPSIDLSACAAAVATFDRISRDYDDVAALMVSSKTRSIASLRSRPSGTRDSARTMACWSSRDR
jgi:thiol peroxidase